MITGASSGIGETFARQLATRGYDLILVARRTDRLEALARDLPTKAEVLTADLATVQGRARVVELLQSEANLQLLVNNAGFGTKGRFWVSPVSDQQLMHEVHVTATLELTHAALPGMVQRGGGAVINVASVAAFFRSEANVSYCATKAWMLAFSESLELELLGAGSPVQVQALCPGFTYSEFHDTLGVSRDRIPKPLWMSADFVVAQSLEALARRQAVVIPGWKYRLLVAVATKLPRRLLMRLQQQSPHTKGRI